MATISGANLVITPNTAAATAQCTVTCRVTFTAYEVNEIKEGLKFSLVCTLWGQDLPPDPDDSLYTFGTKFFPDATPRNPENVTFSATLGSSLLNEDSGTDQIYARLTLKNLYTEKKVTAKSNVVTHSF